MSRIHGRDTTPELIIRKGLHALGFRYPTHDRALPGKPDLVFPKFNAVILVNGCVWHGHECHLLRLPAAWRDFWVQKIQTNKERDVFNLHRLETFRWRAMTVWECALKGRERRPNNETIQMLAEWLLEGRENSELRGEPS